MSFLVGRLLLEMGPRATGEPVGQLCTLADGLKRVKVRAVGGGEWGTGASIFEALYLRQFCSDLLESRTDSLLTFFSTL